MNNILKNKQSLKYKKDIDNIYIDINEHIPKLKNWQLNQSVIFEENKKITCKAITNEKKEKIGNTITIYFSGNNPYSYELIMFENSLSLIKKYFKDNNKVEEIIDIFLGESYINRSCYYKENEVGLSYKEIYNIKENTTKIITNVPDLETEVFDEIREALEEIKDNFKKNNNKKIKHL